MNKTNLTAKPGSEESMSTARQFLTTSILMIWTLIRWPMTMIRLLDFAKWLVYGVFRGYVGYAG